MADFFHKAFDLRTYLPSTEATKSLAKLTTTVLAPGVGALMPLISPPLYQDPGWVSADTPMTDAEYEAAYGIKPPFDPTPVVIGGAVLSVLVAAYIFSRRGGR